MLITGSQPFPFITKEGSLGSFKTISTSQFNSDFSYGDVITGSYPMNARISSDFFDSGILVGPNRKYRILSLKNTLNSYTYLSPHYAFSSSLGDKESQELRLVSIPSIFYGKSIRKGSISCKWYHTGSLIAELQDINKDGELIQVGPSGSLGSGSVAGVALYSEGFLLLTGSWDLHTYTERFEIDSPVTTPSWKYFMTTGSSGLGLVPSSSFGLDFEGVEEIPTMTMIAKAEPGEFNHSNNPTYIEYGQNQTANTSSIEFVENEGLSIKNIVDVFYDEEDPNFEKITYISKIAIYDENKNLIGVAKLAKPARKKMNDNLAIKMKMDF